MGVAPRPTAIVGCVDAEGRILIVKQLAGPFAGAWLLPGGSVEPDERLEDAARRELFEETGYRVDDLTRVAQYDVRSVPAGRFHFLVHLFRDGAVTGTPRAEKGGELRWARPSEIDAHPNLAVALADLGLIVTETVFNIPGVARFLVEALRWRDYPIVQNLVMLIAVVVVVMNFLVDMAYMVLDPRIKYSD